MPFWIALAGLAGLVWYSKKADQRRTRPLLLTTFEEAVVQAAGVLGVQAPPVLAQGHGNASSDGHRISVNVRWLAGVLERHCADGTCRASVLIGIAAHELAHHHLDRAAATNGVKSRARELRADAVAAWTLARTGVPHEDLQAVLVELGFHASRSHPAGLDRAAILERAFEMGAGGVPLPLTLSSLRNEFQLRAAWPDESR